MLYEGGRLYERRRNINEDGCRPALSSAYAYAQYACRNENIINKWPQMKRRLELARIRILVFRRNEGIIKATHQCSV
jgi:hypothetical protein